MYLFSKKHHQQGFTLMELMTVVVIIGILASTAIPLVSRYLKHSKTTEASLNLRKIYDGEISYYQEEHTDNAGNLIPKQFVTATTSPALPPGIDKKIGSWDSGGWPELKFATDGLAQYCYTTVASGVGSAAAFTARAEGDVDGDGAFSLFERVASISAGGDIEGGAAIYELDGDE